MNYWKWFFKGNGESSNIVDNGSTKKIPGYKKFLDKWIFFHAAIGCFITFITPLPLQKIANTVLLPLAGIFIGLSFAWGTISYALLETDEIQEMTEKHPGGFEQYVYTYQSAIFIILLTLVFWGLAGLGIFDQTWPTPCRKILYFFTGAFLFFFASLTLRECWNVTLGTQWFLIARYRILRAKKGNKK